MAITYKMPDPKTLAPGEEIDDIFIVAANQRQAFHKKREELYNLVGQYYRQSSTSTYISEDRLIEVVRECKLLKAEYRKTCDILHSA